MRSRRNLRRSARSRSAPCPGERERSSRPPTAATSSDAATFTGWGSDTGRPSRRLRHRAKNTNATTSWRTKRLTPGEISETRLRPPRTALPSGPGSRTTMSVPCPVASRADATGALSPWASAALTIIPAPPTATTVPDPRSRTTT